MRHIDNIPTKELPENSTGSVGFQHCEKISPTRVDFSLIPDHQLVNFYNYNHEEKKI